MFIELENGKGPVEIVDEEASVLAMWIISTYKIFIYRTEMYTANILTAKSTVFTCVPFPTVV